MLAEQPGFVAPEDNFEHYGHPAGVVLPAAVEQAVHVVQVLLSELLFWFGLSEREFLFLLFVLGE